MAVNFCHTFAAVITCIFDFKQILFAAQREKMLDKQLHSLIAQLAVKQVS